MPSTLHVNTSAPSSGRLRYERVADGVVAGYIHEISRPPRAVTDAAPRPDRSRRAGIARRRAGARRRSHAPLSPRPMTVSAGRPAA
jgi:hypothetical protein